MIGQHVGELWSACEFPEITPEHELARLQYASNASSPASILTKSTSEMKTSKRAHTFKSDLASEKDLPDFVNQVASNDQKPQSRLRDGVYWDGKQVVTLARWPYHRVLSHLPAADQHRYRLGLIELANNHLERLDTVHL